MKLIVCCHKELYLDKAQAAFGGTEFISCRDWRSTLASAEPPFLCLIHETDVGRWNAFSSALVERHGREAGWAAIRYSIEGPQALPRELPHTRVAVLRSDFSRFLALVSERGTAPFLVSLAGGRTDFSLLCRRVPGLDNVERVQWLNTLNGWLDCAENSERITDRLADRAPIALAQVVGWLEPGAAVPALDIDAARTWIRRLQAHPLLHYLDMPGD